MSTSSAVSSVAVNPFPGLPVGLVAVHIHNQLTTTANPVHCAQAPDISMCMHVDMCRHICVYMSLYACIPTHTHTYTCVSIYIYIYIYIRPTQSPAGMKTSRLRQRHESTPRQTNIFPPSERFPPCNSKSKKFPPCSNRSLIALPLTSSDRHHDHCYMP